MLGSELFSTLVNEILSLGCISSAATTSENLSVWGILCFSNYPLTHYTRALPKYLYTYSKTLRDLFVHLISSVMGVMQVPECILELTTFAIPSLLDLLCCRS